ncbi:hypothetical protein EVAR_85828_1 [Eumeta japonica]|uniref:Uncharacterized protein n=1 Tax=Eumeta variegata TaxID=151549 RepID=A0A4C1UQM6_EUMVA|nr:hypothetical protein EVAR_85828_1 [Eumeta japonica]
MREFNEIRFAAGPGYTATGVAISNIEFCLPSAAGGDLASAVSPRRFCGGRNLGQKLIAYIYALAPPYFRGTDKGTETGDTKDPIWIFLSLLEMFGLKLRQVQTSQDSTPLYSDASFGVFFEAQSMTEFVQVKQIFEVAYIRIRALAEARVSQGRGEPTINKYLEGEGKEEESWGGGGERNVMVRHRTHVIRSGAVVIQKTLLCRDSGRRRGITNKLVIYYSTKDEPNGWRVSAAAARPALVFTTSAFVVYTNIMRVEQYRSARLLHNAFFEMCAIPSKTFPELRDSVPTQETFGQRKLALRSTRVNSVVRADDPASARTTVVKLEHAQFLIGIVYRRARTKGAGAAPAVECYVTAEDIYVIVSDNLMCTKRIRGRGISVWVSCLGGSGRSRRPSRRRRRARPALPAARVNAHVGGAVGTLHNAAPQRMGLRLTARWDLTQRFRLTGVFHAVYGSQFIRSGFSYCIASCTRQGYSYRPPCVIEILAVVSRRGRPRGFSCESGCSGRGRRKSRLRPPSLAGATRREVKVNFYRTENNVPTRL